MSPQRCSTLLFLAAAVCAARVPARAQCSDWTGGFYPGGASAPVHSQLVFDDGSGPAHYVGGKFTTIAAAAANAVAKHTPSGWSALGSGITSTTNSVAAVLSMAAFDDGSGPALFVAGTFDVAGGAPAKNIAKWDGSSWSALDTGLRRANGGTAEVLALTVFDDGTGAALYAGGYFDLAGPTTAYNIAKWDGTSWSDIGGGGTNGRVRAIEVYDSGVGARLYIGGDFTKIDGLDKPYLARLIPTAWVKVNGVNAPVHALAVHDDGSGSQLYCGGTTFNGGITGVARWDGTTLSNLPQLNSTPACMTVYDDGLNGPELYVGGSPTWGAPFAKKWNGVGWSDLVAGQLPDGAVRSFCGYDDGGGSRLYAGGDFSAFGPVASNFIARWNGLNPDWNKIGPANTVDGEVFGLGSFDDGTGRSLYAGGNFAHAGGLNSIGVARWKNGLWSDLAGSFAPAYVAHAFETWNDGGGDDLYVGGNVLVINGLTGVNKIARWDGSAWSKLGNGLTNGAYAITHSIVPYVENGTPMLFAAGTFHDSYDNIARWNGSAWSSVGTGLNNDGRALAVYDPGSGPRLYAGGSFTIASGIAASRIASWDGTSWSPLGSGMNGTVRALAVFDDGTGEALYAGGTFTIAGGLAASNVARWDGASWSPLGSGLNGAVNALCVYDDGRGPALYLGGVFTTAGLTVANRLARWDGTNWEALGSGVDNEVNALTVYDDGSGTALFVGGAFLTAGGRVSNFLAKWGRVCCPATSYCTAGTTSNGCVPAISGIGTPSASATSGFTIRVDDVEGQKQGHIFYGLSGAVANPWGPASSSYLCVKAPSQRTPTQDSGGTNGWCDGAMQIDWLDYIATHPSSLGAPFSAGTQVWAQLYFRDPPAPKTTNLSDGLTFVVCP